MPPIPNSLAQLLAAAEKRKHEGIRSRLGIPPELEIDAFHLEALSYHLGERSGAVELRLEADGGLRVWEPGRPGGIVYRGDSVAFLLKTWGITAEQAKTGQVLRLDAGKRVA